MFSEIQNNSILPISPEINEVDFFDFGYEASTNTFKNLFEDAQEMPQRKRDIKMSEMISQEQENVITDF